MAEGARPLAFHAAPPAGQWINDPNGLVHEGGAYRLFVQHRGDSPAFRETGWARFSSLDLLDWTFDGAVIPPEGIDWMYSGSVQRDANGLAAIHTVHADAIERQVRRVSADAGATWSAAEPVTTLGGAARNRRDPYIFRDGAGWALLLAEPCDWRGWRDEPPSRLRLYRSHDGRSWREAGIIGPSHPPGVMWEVPVLARIGGHDVLFVSTVDRREDGAACAVRAWVGALGPDGFTRHEAVSADGQLVDFGPDFYALMAGVEEGWPTGERPWVAWASSWTTARDMGWPGFHGGPITLPRTLTVEDRESGPWVASRPAAHIRSRFADLAPGVPVAGLGTTALARDTGSLRIEIAARSGALMIAADLRGGALTVERTGSARLSWARRERFAPATGGGRTVALYLDGPLVEMFLVEDGVSITAALPNEELPFAINLHADDRPWPLEWFSLGR